MGYKIYVYAICKNESKFVERWVSSMSEADGIYVLDTGSTDDTVALLRQYGAHVTVEKIEPWRFDVARNRSLALVPEDADLCICTDLDEVFEPGWRKGFEAALASGAKRFRYRYTWNFQPDGSEGYVFWIEKAHLRHGFKWAHPVHEVLEYTGGDYVTRDVPGVQINHHADPDKPRSQYLPLLELSVAEDPEDDRNMHYLGREYMYMRMWDPCIETLQRHLALPRATWPDERCASMRFIARAYVAKNMPWEAEVWLLRACAEAPHLREPWLEMAALLLKKENWSGALYFAERALAIRERSRSYINEAESWGARPHDIAAVAAYNLGLWQTAYDQGRLALEKAPGDRRLSDNMKFYAEKV